MSSLETYADDAAATEPVHETRDEILYRQLLDAIPAALYATDAEGRITFFNRAAAEFAGREPELGKDKWCVTWRLYNPDGTLLPHDECLMARALKEQRPIRGVEGIAERPDGTRVPFMPYPTPIFDDAGKLAGAINMLVDTSERRQAIAQVEASEARYRAIFEGARVALWDEDFSPVMDWFDRLRASGVTDIRNYFLEYPDELATGASLIHVRDVNNYALELLDAGAKDILLGSLSKVFVPEAGSLLREELIALWSGQRRFEAEATAHTLKGRETDILLTVSWGGDRCERSLISIVDVSKQKRAEHDQHRLARIVSSSEDAIVSKDLNGVIVSWNAGAEKLFGYTADEAVGKPVTMLIPDDHLDEEPNILSRIRQGEPVEHYDTVRRRKDGTLVDISLSVSPITDADGRIVGASKIARDISERKRAANALSKRIDEQATLYQLTNRLHRAQSLADVYNSAFYAISRGLGCERASILLFDEADVMRFVASRGISEDYRAAVEGHSPWTAGERDPPPICIPDIANSDLSDPLKTTLQLEGIAALCFIPLVVKGALVGKFMTYYSEPHEFRDEERDLALTIARQLGFSIDRMRAEESLRESERRLEQALNAGQMGAWEWNVTTGRVVWSPGLQRIHGLEPGTFGGTFDDFKRDIHPDDLDRVLAGITTAVATDGDYHITYRMNHPDGSTRWLEAFGSFIPDGKGNSQRIAGICTDITERKDAEAQRDLLLAELSHRVKNTLATVISIARQSFSRTQNVDEAVSSFDARVRALARTHTRLAEASWSGVPFQTMLLDELAPYRREDGGNLHVAGPPIRLDPRSALTLGMAMHELATNAAKHGALSTKTGLVEVSWRLDPANQLHIEWTEIGGPKVVAPKRTGFGRLLLERALASDLRGEVQMDFSERGLTCYNLVSIG